MISISIDRKRNGMTKLQTIMTDPSLHYTTRNASTTIANVCVLKILAESCNCLESGAQLRSCAPLPQRGFGVEYLVTLPLWLWCLWLLMLFWLLPLPKCSLLSKFDTVVVTWCMPSAPFSIECPWAWEPRPPAFFRWYFECLPPVILLSRPLLP